MASKVAKYFGYFWQEICSPDYSKIAQSSHTGGEGLPFRKWTKWSFFRTLSLTSFFIHVPGKIFFSFCTIFQLSIKSKNSVTEWNWEDDDDEVEEEDWQKRSLENTFRSVWRNLFKRSHLILFTEMRLASR